MVDLNSLKELVLKRTSISWDWLAGFTQAEGCFTILSSQNAPRFELGQRDPEIVYRIQDFLQVGKVYNIKLSESSKNPEVDFFNYRCFRRDDVFKLTKVLAPLIFGDKKLQVNQLRQHFNLDPVIVQSDINWNFLTGFWEGDGSLALDVDGYPRVDFAQKDTKILAEITIFLKKQGFRSSTFKQVSGVSMLSSYDSIRRGCPLHIVLLQHAQIYKRRAELACRIYYSKESKKED